MVPSYIPILVSISCYIHVAIQNGDQVNTERWASVVNVNPLDQQFPSMFTPLPVPDEVLGNQFPESSTSCLAKLANFSDSSWTILNISGAASNRSMQASEL